MGAPRNRKHIVVAAAPRVDAYSPYASGGPSKAPGPPPSGRPAHAQELRSALERAKAEAAQHRADATISVQNAQPGIYLEFEAVPGWELALDGLERRRGKDPSKHIEVVSVDERASASSQSSSGAAAQPTQHATVFVPEGQLSHFLGRLEQYGQTTPKQGNEKRHENQFDRIAAVRLASLRALWTDEQARFPSADKAVWWELWLRQSDGKELERLYDYANQSGLRLSEHRLELLDRIIVLAHAKPSQLTASLDVLNDMAELRRAKELATFFLDEPAEDQAAWAEDLRHRLHPPNADAPAVTLLDTGLNRHHPLLEAAVSPEDVHAVDVEWGGHDDGGGPSVMGHGTEMAGIALHGDLAELLVSSEPVALRHRLESVKILPPARFKPNEPDLYGAITASAVSRPEIQAPERKRVFSMAVTAPEQGERGRPTSWSAAVDALAAGRAFDAAKQGLVYLDDGSDEAHRLFVVSAGNASAVDRDHLTRSDSEPVEDPAQAWNALTVGAYTERCVIRDSRFSDWEPLARAGELSPFSRTSMIFAPAWPVKPDVVAEGGNAGVNRSGDVENPIPDLLLLTTHFLPREKLFTYTSGTSPASAEVARICACVRGDYPDLWPETVRALVVHSARWRPAMEATFRAAGDRKSQRGRLLRRYGYGVPSMDRALRSASDALTLVAQASLHPFRKKKLREMHLHELPWPKSALEALGDTSVRLRVTLSYFVEPNGARRGWRSRYRYQSHGLRFEVKGSAETTDELRKRLNKQALEEDEARPRPASDPGWYLGSQARNRGSLHSDIWEGSAADLAERGAIAIFPVSGWWKDQPAHDRSDRGVRYALVVSIETPEVEADVWTPVAQQVGVPIVVTT